MYRSGKTKNKSSILVFYSEDRGINSMIVNHKQTKAVKEDKACCVIALQRQQWPWVTWPISMERCSAPPWVPEHRISLLFWNAHKVLEKPCSSKSWSMQVCTVISKTWRIQHLGLNKSTQISHSELLSAAYQSLQMHGNSFRSLILALLLLILDWADSFQDRSGHVLDRIRFVLD